MRIWSLINLIRQCNLRISSSFFEDKRWQEYERTFLDFDILYEQKRYEELRKTLPDNLVEEILSHIEMQFYLTEDRLYSYNISTGVVQTLSILEAFQKFKERILDANEYGSCGINDPIDINLK